jgi:hypothetical protein
MAGARGRGPLRRPQRAGFRTFRDVFHAVCPCPGPARLPGGAAPRAGPLPCSHLPPGCAPAKLLKRAGPWPHMHTQPATLQPDPPLTEEKVWKGRRLFTARRAGGPRRPRPAARWLCLLGRAGIRWRTRAPRGLGAPPARARLRALPGGGGRRGGRRGGRLAAVGPVLLGDRRPLAGRAAERLIWDKEDLGRVQRPVGSVAGIWFAMRQPRGSFEGERQTIVCMCGGVLGDAKSGPWAWWYACVAGGAPVAHRGRARVAARAPARVARACACSFWEGAWRPGAKTGARREGCPPRCCSRAGGAHQSAALRGSRRAAPARPRMMRRRRRPSRHERGGRHGRGRG